MFQVMSQRLHKVFLEGGSRLPSRFMAHIRHDTKVSLEMVKGTDFAVGQTRCPRGYPGMARDQDLIEKAYEERNGTSQVCRRTVY